jgi:hypothetical protein
MGYVAPEFSGYDKGLAIAMTYWLFHDPLVNPNWDDESKWGVGNGPRVQFVKRSVVVDDLTTVAQTVTLDQLFGGKNALIFSQCATVTNIGVKTLEQIPNTRSGYVKYQQQKAEGYYEVEDTSLNNVFGTTPGQPWMYAVPKFWYGPDSRDFRFIQVDTTTTVDVDVAFLAAVLDTGR